MIASTMPWEQIAQEAQAYRDASIARLEPPVPQIPINLPLNVSAIPNELLTEAEIRITTTPPEQLASLLSDGSLSSVEVTTAFMRRAGLAQKLVNCVTEIMPEAALERARYCDAYFARHKKPIGLLHGLPISVKEHVSMKGLSLSCGFVGWWDHVGTFDAHVLRLLYNAGAVFYVRTTEPQCLMHLETSSNLYGPTLNPFNRNLTSGGSSGGEGALIGIRGSCLGIGTDIGGSIRSPAANNGIWGFRPSSYRTPLEGSTAPMAGYEQIVPVLGPLATTFEGLQLFMKAVIDQQPWLTEPSLLPMAWTYPCTQGSRLRKPDGSIRLKVAVMWYDGVVKPHPPVTRALKELTTQLQTHANVELVDWIPLKHDLAWKIISSLYFPDGAKEDKEIMEQTGEPVLPLTRFIIDEQPEVKELTVPELWARTVERESYRTEYAAYWNETSNRSPSSPYPVDVILSPVGPGAAPPLDHARYWGYTSQWNLLDYPAMVFPYTVVDQEKDKAEVDHVPMNEQDGWNWRLYTGPERYRDAPVCLQLIGRRYQDEKVFEAMELIKRAVGI